MLRILLRVGVMVGAVLAGHALGGLLGAVLGACVGTVVVTQTEDVVRIARRSLVLGGSGLQVLGRGLSAFFGHTLVRRLVRTFLIALVAGAATWLGNALGGKVGAILAAAAAVALGQAVAPGNQAPQAAAPEHQHHA
jgi:hypothetical protein